jgi:hypothetical protein
MMGAMEPPPVYGFLHGLLYYPDEASRLVTTPGDALTHALAVQRLARMMVLGMNAPDEVNDGDEELLAHLSQYVLAWTRRAKELLAAQPTTAAVHPPLGEPVTHGERVADCPVCGAAILGGSGVDLSCDRCHARMHGECYFGRVATLAEWQEYIRNVNGGPEEPEDFTPDVVCAQCRAKGESA